MCLRLLLMALAFAATGCAYPPANVISEYSDACATGEKPSAAVFLFVTERVPNCFGSQVSMSKLRGSQLLYGGADDNYKLHFYRQADWVAELKSRLKSGRAPLLFVHGYNNGNLQALQDALAIRKAVQPHVEVIGFTWPSYHRMVSYTGDEANADWATNGLRQLLNDQRAVLGPPNQRLIVIAHSMGNRIALNALQLMPERERIERIARFIMASPDVDRAKLIADAPELHVPVTIYGSTRDQALSGSWRIHGLPRAGDLSTWISGHRPDFALGNTVDVEVIDTSAVTRGIVHHSDYLDAPEAAADICRVVNNDDPKQGRIADPRGPHWLLVKHSLGRATDPCAANGQAAADWLKRQ